MKGSCGETKFQLRILLVILRIYSQPVGEAPETTDLLIYTRLRNFSGSIVTTEKCFLLARTILRPNPSS